MKRMSRDYSPYSLDLDQEYKPKQIIARGERSFNGFENNAVMREIFVEFEYMIEEVIGYNRIKNK